MGSREWDRDTKWDASGRDWWDLHVHYHSQQWTGHACPSGFHTESEQAQSLMEINRHHKIQPILPRDAARRSWFT